jgi:gluconate 2-dehydrogenase subunit 3-like protein
MNQETKYLGFSSDEARILASVLDEIIPPSDDGCLPGAGQLGLARHIDEVLQSTPELRSMIAQGLSVLDDLATKRYAQRFVELSKENKSAAMNALAVSEHAFPPILLMHVYAGYYQNTRVVTALGLEARPPHPQGYHMEPNDLTLLDPVRGRPKLYREC